MGVHRCRLRLRRIGLAAPSMSGCTTLPSTNGTAVNHGLKKPVDNRVETKNPKSPDGSRGQQYTDHQNGDAGIIATLLKPHDRMPARFRDDPRH